MKKIPPHTTAWCCLIILLATGCDTDYQTKRENEIKDGYQPVYGAAAQSTISLLPARGIKNPGKIYTYGKYLLVNEQKQGIHIFDNENPSMPVAMGFIQMLGNSDMAIRNDVLYADHLGNLVSLTFVDFDHLELTGSLQLRNWHLGLPPPAGFHFECVDPTRGLVVGWKRIQLTNPDCYAL